MPPYAAFTVAFWHPFGPHGRESAESIIAQKRREIETNGWTLWSFQYRLPETHVAWHRQLTEVDPERTYVFCSNSPDASDPAGDDCPSCRNLRFHGDLDWQPMPSGVQVPHPFRTGKDTASAFIVRDVIYPLEPFALPAVEWFSRDKGPWRHDRAVPTRGEFLVRPGGSHRMREVRAVLELMPPYLAMVKR